MADEKAQPKTVSTWRNRFVLEQHLHVYRI